MMIPYVKFIAALTGSLSLSAFARPAIAQMTALHRTDSGPHTAEYAALEATAARADSRLA